MQGAPARPCGLALMGHEDAGCGRRAILESLNLVSVDPADWREIAGDRTMKIFDKPTFLGVRDASESIGAIGEAPFQAAEAVRRLLSLNTC